MFSVKLSVNTVISIAEELYREISSSSDTSAGAIGLWLRDNIGKISSLILKDFIIDTASNNQITPELNEMEKAILKKLYLIHYYTIFIRKNLGAASFDSVLEIDSDGATIRMVNKNEVSKTYLQLRRSEEEELERLITGYKNSTGLPLSIAGDDTISQTFENSDLYRRNRNFYG